MGLADLKGPALQQEVNHLDTIQTDSPDDALSWRSLEYMLDSTFQAGMFSINSLASTVDTMRMA